jgi:hypothetical protein
MPRTSERSADAANTACPLSRRIRAAEAFGFTSKGRCVTMIFGCSTFSASCARGVGHAFRWANEPVTRSWILLIYPASTVGFAAVVLFAPSTHTLVNVGLLAVACLGAWVNLSTFVTLAAQSFKEKRMQRRYPEIRDIVRKHRVEHYPDLPDEAELQRGMFQIKLMTITTGLVSLFLALVLASRFL